MFLIIGIGKWQWYNDQGRQGKKTWYLHEKSEWGKGERGGGVTTAAASGKTNNDTERYKERRGEVEESSR